jgi:hypothetical protein
MAHMGVMRSAYKILDGKPKGKRPLKRPRHRWKNDVKLDLKEIRFGNMDWICLAQVSYQWWDLVNIVVNLQFP